MQRIDAVIKLVKKEFQVFEDKYHGFSTDRKSYKNLKSEIIRLIETLRENEDERDI